MNSYKVLAYIPDEELEDRINEVANLGYIIKQMWRNKPFGGGVENTTVLMEKIVYQPFPNTYNPFAQQFPNTIEVMCENQPSNS